MSQPSYDGTILEKPKPVFQMHEWESQEKLLTNLEQQDVRNFLEYKDFQYQKHEWDNIPPIVPRYLIYLGKYMKGVSGFCSKLNELESTDSIRKDLDSKYYELHENIKQKRILDLEEKQAINKKLEGFSLTTDHLEKHIKDQREDKEFCMSQNMYNLYDTPAFKLLEDDQFLSPSKSKTKAYENKSFYQSRPRLFSLDQIRDLFFIHLNRSELLTQFQEVQGRTKDNEESIKQLIIQDENIKNYIDQKITQVNERFQKMQESMDKQQIEINSKQADLGNKINLHTEQIRSLNDFQRDMIRYQDHVRQMNEKTNLKIDREKQNLTEIIEQNVTDLKTKIQELEKFTTDQMDSISDSIETFKVQTKEVIDNKEKMIMLKANTSISEMRKNLDETTKELNQQRIEIQQKYELKFNKIKQVITQYFEKYDIDLEEVKINMKVLNQKYADWSKILIEPTSLNEARLYALETRIHEEEEIRIKEYEYVRDLFKKLIFSLEQTNIQNIELQKNSTITLGAKNIERDLMTVNQQSRNGANGSQLPNLLQTSTMSRGVGQSISIDKSQQPQTLNDLSMGLQQKTNEIMMLKRLNFLKTSLDGHSPKQTTQQIRLKSQKKRDERVVEIWKKEMEQPSVQDILSSYVKTKQGVSLDIEDQSQPLPLSTQMMSRNLQDPLSQEDSLLMSNRQPGVNPLSTVFDTSMSQVKASNDSAFLTQKHVSNQPGNSLAQNQQLAPLKNMNQTMYNQKLNSSFTVGVTIDESQNPRDQVTLAEKINRNKFVTTGDKRLIQEQKKKIETSIQHKDKLYDTFWSDFETQVHPKNKSQIRQRPNVLSEYNDRLNMTINNGAGVLDNNKFKQRRMSKKQSQDDNNYQL